MSDQNGTGGTATARRGEVGAAPRTLVLRGREYWATSRGGRNCFRLRGETLELRGSASSCWWPAIFDPQSVVPTTEPEPEALHGVPLTAPGTPSTPGQGGTWRDTTRNGTPVRNVAWDGEAWTGEYQTEGGDWHGTYWYADGSFAPGGTPRGLDLIAATPTPAPSPAAEVDAVDRILRLIETEDFGPEYRRRTADRVALFDAIWQEHDRRPRADGYSERDSFYNGFLVGWAQGEKSLRQSLAALARATRTEGGAS